jgi:hypothetical protein
MFLLSDYFLRCWRLETIKTLLEDQGSLHSPSRRLSKPEALRAGGLRLFEFIGLLGLIGLLELLGLLELIGL